MDGFDGYKTAATEVLPKATAVMDPFHVVALAGAKLDLTHQRIQQATCGHRGRTGDPLYGMRRTLRTRLPLLTSRQRTRLEAVFADHNHLGVMATCSVYQRIIAAYSHPDRRRGKTMMTAIIDSLRRGVPAVLEELAQLGRTRHRRRHDALAFFDHHTSNGPTQAIKAALKHCAATPSDSATSPTTAGAHCCTAAPCTHWSMHSELRRPPFPARMKGAARGARRAGFVVD